MKKGFVTKSMRSMFESERKGAALLSDGPDERDDDLLDEDSWNEDGPEPGEECGRWDNGRLMQFCTKAGSEECDFECPYSR